MHRVKQFGTNYFCTCQAGSHDLYCFALVIRSSKRDAFVNAAPIFVLWKIVLRSISEGVVCVAGRLQRNSAKTFDEDRSCSKDRAEGHMACPTLRARCRP